MLPYMSFKALKLNGLQQPQRSRRSTPYTRTNELRLHVKFEPPRFTGLAVHRSHTEVETKRGLANICLDTFS